MAMLIQFAVGKPTDWFKRNLGDFIWSLNKTLRKNNQGEATGAFEGGFLIVRVTGCSREVVQPYLDSFVHAMRKDGQRFMVNVDESL